MLLKKFVFGFSFDLKNRNEGDKMLNQYNASSSLKQGNDIQIVEYYKNSEFPIYIIDENSKNTRKTIFEEKLDRAILNSKCNEQAVLVNYIELIGADEYIDEDGKPAGTKLLLDIANDLDSVIKINDGAYKIRDNKIILFVQNIDDFKSAEKFVNEVSVIISNYFDVIQTNITTKIGCSIYPIDGKDSKALIYKAYAAANIVKKNLLNLNFFKTEDILEDLKLSNRLYQAIENYEFELFYQPQVNPNTNAIVCIEALVRWRHPEQGIIDPIRFIPVAEKTGQLLKSIDGY